SVRPVVTAAEIEHVKRAAGSQHARDRVQGSTLLVALEVVEHERREDAVVGAVRIRQLVGIPAIERYRYVLTVRLSPGAVERLRVGVEPDDVDRRVERLHEQREVAGPAADLEAA